MKSHIKKIVAVIGTSSADEEEWKTAEEVGRQIAKKGWVLVNGGLSGVMEASAKGAMERGGTVVGILPTPSADSANPFITIPIATNMGHARNAIIAHTADVLIAIGGGDGTLSEIAIARKLGKTVFGIKSWDVAGVTNVKNADEAIGGCERILSEIL